MLVVTVVLVALWFLGEDDDEFVAFKPGIYHPIVETWVLPSSHSSSPSCRRDERAARSFQFGELYQVVLTNFLG